MADFEAPSFSLGLDFDLHDSELQITSPCQDRDPTHFSVSPAPLNENDNDFETLIADDSEPEHLDARPKLKRLRRGLTMDAALSSISSAASSSISGKFKEELRPMAVVDEECTSTDEHQHTQHPAAFTSSKGLTNQPGKRMPNLPNAYKSVLTSCNNKMFPSLTVGSHRRLRVIESDSDLDEPSVSDDGNDRKCNRSKSYVGLSKQRIASESIDLSTTEIPYEDFRSEKIFLDLDDSLPPAHHYFFHDDMRIQELVRSRLPNFSPLGNTLNRDLERLSTSQIDYIGQFRFESSKQATRNIKGKKGSSSRTVSRNLETEEAAQGWVNPKVCLDKGITKTTAKRKVHAAAQSAGRWLTSPDGKKVYVGKTGRELTGRAAYIQYKKESGLGFKKRKRKSATKRKKK